MTINATNHNRLFEQILSDHRLRRDLVQQSFEHFFPIYFHRYMQYEVAPFHREIFSILQDESIKFAVIVAFRGSAKSTLITTAYALWSILGIQQRKFIVIAGQTEQKARQHLVNIKNELLFNELLRRDLGPFEEERNSLGNATAIIIKRLNVRIMITSVEQSIRGMRHGEHRPDLIILDDIEDTNSVKTREGRNKVFNWLTGEIIPAGSKRTRIIAVGNLLHEDSVLKRLQRRIEAGDMNALHAVYREYPIIDSEGKPLWAGKYPTPESIDEEKQRTGDEIAWSREYLLRIISSTEQIVHPEWIRTYESLPTKDLRAIYISTDLAVSERDSADCTAIIVFYVYGYSKDMRVFIQPHPINARLTFPEQVERIKAVHAVHRLKHHIVKILIEDVGYQRAMAQALEAERYDVVCISVGRTDKSGRLRLTTSFIREGQVLFPAGSCDELIEQLIGYGKELHDDLTDAFSLGVLKIFGEAQPLAVGYVGSPKRL